MQNSKKFTFSLLSRCALVVTESLADHLAAAVLWLG